MMTADGLQIGKPFITNYSRLSVNQLSFSHYLMSS